MPTLREYNRHDFTDWVNQNTGAGITSERALFRWGSGLLLSDARRLYRVNPSAADASLVTLGPSLPAFRVTTQDGGLEGEGARVLNVIALSDTRAIVVTVSDTFSSEPVATAQGPGRRISVRSTFHAHLATSAGMLGDRNPSHATGVFLGYSEQQDVFVDNSGVHMGPFYGGTGYERGNGLGVRTSATTAVIPVLGGDHLTVTDLGTGLLAVTGGTGEGYFGQDYEDVVLGVEQGVGVHLYRSDGTHQLRTGHQLPLQASRLGPDRFAGIMVSDNAHRLFISSATGQTVRTMSGLDPVLNTAELAHFHYRDYANLLPVLRRSYYNAAGAMVPPTYTEPNFVLESRDEVALYSETTLMPVSEWILAGRVPGRSTGGDS